ncbi:hypothetical protein M885DRAFT_550619 [Pelagophyceae sp. CCMP2097]|nr:hypothetical protein M885DRAFT_550619 [Pelagophyceae sp. CCMP2097]
MGLGVAAVLLLWAPLCALRAAPQRRWPRRRAKANPLDEEQKWRRDTTKVDIDDKMVYSMFRRQFGMLFVGFNPKKQLAVSAWRGSARLRDLELNASVLNLIFNPGVLEDVDQDEPPVQLVGARADRVSVAWKSLFSLAREPLDVRVARLELDLDFNAPRPSPRAVARAKADWVALVGEPTSPLASYPIGEGARYVIDELVLTVRGVATPLPRYAQNATVRVTARGLEAQSVDATGQPNDLKQCWKSLNADLEKNRTNAANKRKPKRAYIAKRIVARQIEIQFAEEAVEPPHSAPAADAVAAAVDVAVAAARDAAARDAASPMQKVLDGLKPEGLKRGNETAQPPDDRTDGGAAWFMGSLAGAHFSKKAEPPEAPSPRVAAALPVPSAPPLAALAAPRCFEAIADAPFAEALVTIGYDVKTHGIVQLKYDVDGRQLRLNLDRATLTKAGVAAPADDEPTVDFPFVEFFATLGTGVPRSDEGALSASESPTSPLAFLSNRIVRPLLAFVFFLWAAKIT